MKKSFWRLAYTIYLMIKLKNGLEIEDYNEFYKHLGAEWDKIIEQANDK